MSRDGSMLLINGVLTKFLHPSSFWDICCRRKWKFLLSRPSLHSWAINRLNPCLGEFRRIKKHYARIHKPQFRFPMKNRKPPYCLPEDKAQVQFKAMYQLGHGEIRYQQLLTNGSLSKLTSSLSTPWSQLAWIDLTILFFSLPVASSNKFPEFQKQPECHIFQRTCSAVMMRWICWLPALWMIMPHVWFSQKFFTPHVESFTHLHHSDIPMTLKATAEACAPAVLSFPSLSSAGFVLSKS